MDRKVDHHYPIWLLHAGCLFLCAGIIVIGVVLIWNDGTKPWRFFQDRSHSILQAARANDQIAKVASSETGLVCFGTQWTRLALENGDDVAVSGRKQFHELVLPDLNSWLGPIEVPRRERCVTCHALIDWANATPNVRNFSEADKGPIWTIPTSYSEPVSERFPQEKTLELVLPIISREQDAGQASFGTNDRPKGKGSSVALVFGFSWVKPGILKEDEPRIAGVIRGSPADVVGLRPGDLICAIGSFEVRTQDQAEKLLFELVEQPRDSSEVTPQRLVLTYYPAAFGNGQNVPGIQITILRGLPNPWAGHPKQELYVSEPSPHPVSRFGCTICHDGQGLALDYAGAEHPPIATGACVPNKQALARVNDVAPPIEPMILTQLVESRCLRCHDKVFDLVESEIQLEPAARNLVEGRRLVEKFGCYSCHELYPRSPLGDSVLTLSSPVREIAEELVTDPKVPQKVQETARRLLETPEEQDLLSQLLENVLEWQSNLENEANRSPNDQYLVEARQQARQLVGTLRSARALPGGLPRVGPSLRYVASKLAPQTISSVIKKPQELRPESRMPQIFGLTGHLSEESADRRSQFEEIEIEGIARYLSSRSRPLPELSRPESSSEKSEDKLGNTSLIDAGRILFETQGCLACHRHRDFPDVTADFGPNLSDLGKRLSPEAGRSWLRLWLTSPQSLSPSTRMPQPQFRADAWIYRLLGAPGSGEQDNGLFTSTYIVSALVEFLLSSQSVSRTVEQQVPLPVNLEHLDDVVLDYLSADLATEKAKEIVKKGTSVADVGKYSLQVSLELAELVGEPTIEKKLRYVGRKAIGRYGCYGCHSISGFEGWPPIGPSLSRFGSKATPLLDFGAVTEGLLSTLEGREIQRRVETPLDKSLSQLNLLRRETWLWLKLTSPRAFDFKAVEDKPILQHSRMGRFPLSGEQRQAVMAFVLGLEGRPVPSKYNPYSPSRQILALGREIIERKGCDRCHALRPEQWVFRFLKDELSPEAVGGSQEISSAIQEANTSSKPQFGYGLVVGYAERDATGEIIEDRDELDNPLYFFTPWRPARLGDHVWPVGEASIPIASTQVMTKREQDGGAFVMVLYPRVISLTQQLQLTMGPKEMWGCLPPNLYHKGEALQSSWLEQYLREPYPIRPAVPLAMPRYQLTTQEIQTLIGYFSTIAGRTEGSEEAWRTIETRLRLRDQEWPGRLDAAWKLIHESKTYCAKCHIFGEDTGRRLVLPTEAPRLDEVYRRLRGRYLREWVTNPKRILPYTAMPVNFPADGHPLDGSVFNADSRVQLEAVLDLLEHYDWYARQRLAEESVPRQPQ